MNKVKDVSSMLLLAKNMASHQVLKEFSVDTAEQLQDDKGLPSEQQKVALSILSFVRDV